jgi:hypothetical protein
MLILQRFFSLSPSLHPLSFDPQSGQKPSPAHHHDPTPQWLELTPPRPPLFSHALGDHGGLGGKEETEPASETTPSDSPTALRPPGHATRAHSLANLSHSCCPLCVGDRVDAHPCSESCSTRNLHPFTHSSTAPHQNFYAAHDVDSRGPHHPWSLSNTYVHRNNPTSSTPYSPRRSL